MNAWLSAVFNVVRSWLTSLNTALGEFFEPASVKSQRRRLEQDAADWAKSRRFEVMPRDIQLRSLCELFCVLVEASRMKRQWRDYQQLWHQFKVAAEQERTWFHFDLNLTQLMTHLEMEGFPVSTVNAWRDRVYSLYRHVQILDENEAEYQLYIESVRKGIGNQSVSSLSPVLREALQHVDLTPLSSQPVSSVSVGTSFVYDKRSTTSKIELLTECPEQSVLEALAAEALLLASLFSMNHYDASEAQAGSVASRELCLHQELSRLVMAGVMSPVEALLHVYIMGSDHFLLVDFVAHVHRTAEENTLAEATMLAESAEIKAYHGAVSLSTIRKAPWGDEHTLKALRTLAWFSFQEQRWSVDTDELCTLILDGELDELPMGVVSHLVATMSDASGLRYHYRDIKNILLVLGETRLWKHPVRADELVFWGQ